MRRNPAPTLAAAAVALLLAACGSTGGGSDAADPASTRASTAASSAAGIPSTAARPRTGDTTTAGAYLTRAEYQSRMAARAGSKVVYFFHASWCPTCRSADEALEAEGVPAGLTVVKVDFDSEADLRTKYGVTTQHTFVQVDPDGAELATWTGSRDGAEILAKTV